MRQGRPWLKVYCDLDRCGQIHVLADRLGIGTLAAVGAVVVFWSWVKLTLGRDRFPVPAGTDCNSDGRASPNVTVARHRKWRYGDGDVTGVTLSRDRTFVSAMVELGWLRIEDAHVVIPEFDDHFSLFGQEKDLHNERQRRYRHRKGDGESDAQASPNVTVARLKSDVREEKKRISSSSSLAEGADNGSELTPAQRAFGLAREAGIGAETVYRIGTAVARGVLPLADLERIVGSAKSPGEIVNRISDLGPEVRMLVNGGGAE